MIELTKITREDVSSDKVTLSNLPGKTAIEGQEAMNTIVNRNRDFINELEKLEEPTNCQSISIIDLCQKVSSTLHFNIC